MDAVISVFIFLSRGIIKRLVSQIYVEILDEKGRVSIRFEIYLDTPDFFFPLKI